MSSPHPHCLLHAEYIFLAMSSQYWVYPIFWVFHLYFNYCISQFQNFRIASFLYLSILVLSLTSYICFLIIFYGRMPSFVSLITLSVGLCPNFIYTDFLSWLRFVFVCLFFGLLSFLALVSSVLEFYFAASSCSVDFFLFFSLAFPHILTLPGPTILQLSPIGPWVPSAEPHLIMVTGGPDTLGKGVRSQMGVTKLGSR